MIEVASYPTDMSIWDKRQPRFYLEVFGETQPLVDMAYAELQLNTPGDGSDQAPGSSSLIYQYWWTIGHDGDPEQLRTFWSRVKDDSAARVYIYFPLNKGWRIKELVATVKYLQPFHEHLSLWDKLANDYQHMVAPAVAGLGNVVGAVPGWSGAGAVLAAIGKLQVNSISPQAPGFEWAVSKVTTTWPGHGVVQGVMWRLPKRMFVDLGGRLTGSLALSFIPSQRQQAGTVGTQAPVLEPGDILCHAVVRGPDGDVWAPHSEQFVQLRVAPRVSPTGASHAGPASGAS